MTDSTLSKSDLKRMSKNELIRIVINQHDRLVQAIDSNPDNGLVSANEVKKIADLAYKRGAADTLEAIDNQLKAELAEIENEDQSHD